MTSSVFYCASLVAQERYTKSKSCLLTSLKQGSSPPRLPHFLQSNSLYEKLLRKITYRKNLQLQPLLQQPLHLDEATTYSGQIIGWPKTDQMDGETHSPHSHPSRGPDAQVTFRMRMVDILVEREKEFAETEN